MEFQLNEQEVYDRSRERISLVRKKSKKNKNGKKTTLRTENFPEKKYKKNKTFTLANK